MIRLLALLLWLPMAAFAQTYPVPLSDTISDYADLLPPEAEARVAAALQAARKETGVHIVLATIEAQADYGGKGRFADFATGWFNAWGIGDKQRNDGILILVGRADREVRITLGDGYDVIWDGRAQRVIDTAMLPAFRDDDYARGLEEGVDSAIERLARPFAAKEAVTADSGFPQPSVWEAIIPVLLTVFGVGAVLMAIFRKGLGDFVMRIRRCPNCGLRHVKVTRRTTKKPGEKTKGVGVRHAKCSNCGFDRQTSYSLPSKEESRSSSSGSSGFGGGSSGGGGASGKW